MSNPLWECIHHGRCNCELYCTNQYLSHGLFCVWFFIQTAAYAQVCTQEMRDTLILSSLNACLHDSSHTCYPTASFFTLCPHKTPAQPFIGAKDDHRSLRETAVRTESQHFFFWLVDNILKKWSLKKDRFLIFFPHWWLSLDPCNHWNPVHPDMNWHVVQTMLCLSIPTKPFDTAPNWELVDFHFFSCKDCCLTRQSLWWRWGTEERSNL